MENDPEEEARRIQSESLPLAAKTFLGLTLGDEELPLDELMMKSLKLLPEGRIKKKKDIRILQSVDILLRDLPSDSSLRDEIRRVYNDAVSRMV